MIILCRETAKLSEHLFELGKLDAHQDNSIGFFSTSLGESDLVSVVDRTVQKWSEHSIKKQITIQFTI